MPMARRLSQQIVNTSLFTTVEIPVDQLDTCYTLCAAQHREGLLVGTFEPAIFRRNWETFLDEGEGTIIGLHQAGSLCGILGGVTVCDSQTGSLIGKTVFYYIRKDVLTRSAALVLFTRFQQWAFARGAMCVMLCVPFDGFQSRVDPLLQEHGYQVRTITYTKLL